MLLVNVMGGNKLTNVLPLHNITINIGYIIRLVLLAAYFIVYFYVTFATSLWNIVGKIEQEPHHTAKST